MNQRRYDVAFTMFRLLLPLTLGTDASRDPETRVQAVADFFGPTDFCSTAAGSGPPEGLRV